MTDKIKAENAIKWIDGLFTTEEKQVEGILGNKHTGFCCLGFGCHLLGISYDYEDQYNDEFASRVGLNETCGAFKGERFNKGSVFGLDTLAELNDEGGLSFKDISVFIKSRAKDLFEEGVAELINEHYAKT